MLLYKSSQCIHGKEHPASVFTGSLRAGAPNDRNQPVSNVAVQNPNGYPECCRRLFPPHNERRHAVRSVVSVTIAIGRSRRKAGDTSRTVASASSSSSVSLICPSSAREMKVWSRRRDELPSNRSAWRATSRCAQRRCLRSNSRRSTGTSRTGAQRKRRRSKENTSLVFALNQHLR